MSSSIELDSSFVQSTIGELTTTTQTYNKKQKLLVWQYCRRLIADEDQDYLYCARCPPNPAPEDYIEPYYTKHLENIKKHLFRHYCITVEKALSKNQVEVNQQLKQLYYQAEGTGTTNELDTKILKAQLNKLVITEALISLIVVRNLSFCLVEWPEFHTLCQTLNRECKGIITTAHSQVRVKVSKAWGKHKDIVRRELQSALLRIHISLDIQTSPKRWLLLAICAHFTTHLYKKQKALLALQKVPGHSGENQFSILLLVLEDYGIVRKLGAIIADNASPNNVLCQFIESHWENELELEWNANYQQICYIGHIINLAIQAFLFANIIKIEELESYDDQD